jgi:hypothetical protein
MPRKEKTMNITPYPKDVACSGPDAPKCEQVFDLIRLLVTIWDRWGNTAVKYRVTWGGSALWVEDEMRQKIARLEKKVKQLNDKLAAKNQ